MPDSIQGLVAAGPDSWPPQFTPQDRDLMAAVDALTMQLCQEFATTAFAYRQKIFTALLTARDGVN